MGKRKEIEGKRAKLRNRAETQSPELGPRIRREIGQSFLVLAKIPHAMGQLSHGLQLQKAHTLQGRPSGAKIQKERKSLTYLYLLVVLYHSNRKLGTKNRSMETRKIQNIRPN